MILIIIRVCELLLRISPRIINSLRGYIKHSKECFLLFPNTSKLVKKTRLRLVFPNYFSVFGNRRKHSSSCLIYYLKRYDDVLSLVAMNASASHLILCIVVVVGEGPGKVKKKKKN